MTGFLLPLRSAPSSSSSARRPVHLPGLGAPDIARLDYGFGARRLQLAAILLGLVGMLVLGWLDDRHELAPLPKFAGQFLIAALVAAAGVRVTLFVPRLVFSYTITILWIVGLTNALNFLDNMNGLCAGIGALAAAILRPRRRPPRPIPRRRPRPPRLRRPARLSPLELPPRLQRSSATPAAM
jgi:uncharacterized membrane protein YeaQ/YmgE (transglycosylase-associated protein family)